MAGNGMQHVALVRDMLSREKILKIVQFLCPFWSS